MPKLNWYGFALVAGMFVSAAAVVGAALFAWEALS